MIFLKVPYSAFNVYILLECIVFPVKQTYDLGVANAMFYLWLLEKHSIYKICEAS